MTEAEWNASTDPAAMLHYLHYITYDEPTYGGVTTQSRYQPLASDRKLRLFACACASFLAKLYARNAGHYSMRGGHGRRHSGR